MEAGQIYFSEMTQLLYTGMLMRLPAPDTEMNITETHLDGSVSRSCDKPLIARLHGDGPHPAKVTADDLSQETQCCYKKGPVNKTTTTTTTNRKSRKQSGGLDVPSQLGLTRDSFHGACHCGLGIVGAFLISEEFLVPPPSMSD